MSVRCGHLLPYAREIQNLHDPGAILLKNVLQRDEHALLYAVCQDFGVIQNPAADYIRIVAGVQSQVHFLCGILISLNLQIHLNVCLLLELIQHVELAGGAGIVTEDGEGIRSLIYDRKSLRIHNSVHLAVCVHLCGFRGGFSVCRVPGIVRIPGIIRFAAPPG